MWGHMQPEGDNGAGGLGGQGRLPRSRAGGSAWTFLSWLEVSWGQPGGGSLGLVPCVGSPEQKLLHILFLGGPTLQGSLPPLRLRPAQRGEGGELRPCLNDRANMNSPALPEERRRAPGGGQGSGPLDWSVPGCWLSANPLTTAPHPTPPHSPPCGGGKTWQPAWISEPERKQLRDVKGLNYGHTVRARLEIRLPAPWAAGCVPRVGTRRI